jgi:membrane protease YdiL (CAAX protease family)
MILATIAGVAYGKAFEKSNSVFSSVTCHALVDAVKHLWF